MSVALHPTTVPFTPATALADIESFTARVAGTPVVLRPGAVAPAAAAWLAAHRAGAWAVVSAANPHSFALSPEANRQRHRSLVRTLAFEGVRFVEATLADFDGDHPAVVIFDAGLDRVLALGRAFAQGQVLCGDAQAARFAACEGLEFHI